MSDAYEIVPGSRVFFGPAATTWKPAIMSSFTHVVNCDSDSDSTSPEGQSKHFLFLKSHDEETYPILSTHFRPLCNYIETALKDPNARVYIHCYMGMNRSAALAVAYACELTGYPAIGIIENTRRQLRRLILTNQGFEAQLKSQYPIPS